MNFRDFVEENQRKAWKAKRDDVLQMWQTIRPYMPIHAEPVPIDHFGTRYRYDGIRITGTASFINSILSRLKDFLKYESRPGIVLDVEYEQIKSKENEPVDVPRYVCYIHVMEEPPEVATPSKKKAKLKPLGKI
jgi:hypothetical protein